VFDACCINNKVSCFIVVDIYVASALATCTALRRDGTETCACGRKLTNSSSGTH
jgi:hypothetical protein